MICENFLCIYEENNECLLDTVMLDIQGQCTSCIYINIERDLLYSLKERTREQLDPDT